MSKKTTLLIREIARLFVEYKLDDWTIILDHLKSGGIMQHEIATAIESLIFEATVSKKKAGRKSSVLQRRSASKIRKLEHEVSPERLDVLGPVKLAMTKKQMLPTMRNVREVYHQLGIKAAVPADRSRAIEDIIKHLDAVPEDRFEEALAIVTAPGLSSGANLGDDYRRWFEVITKEVK